MGKKKRDIKSFSADELLEELRFREQAPEKRVFGADHKTEKQRAMGALSSKKLAKALREKQKVIYGMDDRMDKFEIESEGVLDSASGVACLIDTVDLEDNGDGTSTIRTVSFKNAQLLCDGETFAEQPTSAFCSGFLVGKQLLATAGHCVNNNNLARTRIVFGFEMLDEDKANVVIPNEDIYSGISFVAHRLESAGADYAVIKLDRPVTSDHAILPLRRTGKIEDGKAVYVIGHPSGLPVKYAPNAIVRDNDSTEFFVANLDTYGGNSGSPVFDQDTHVVEGILVRGETDFVSTGTCRVSNTCPTTGCRGEDVTRATEFADFVPESEDEIVERPGELGERVIRLEQAVEGIAGAVKRIEEKLN